jgi:hypothetical protein
MLTWFTEDSLVPLILGSFLTLSFLGLAIAHYSRAMLGLGLVVALLTVTIVGIEAWVVTEREALENLVRRLASAVEKHNVDEIVAAISDRNAAVQSRARQEMQNYRIESCRLLDFTDFNLDDSQEPVTAKISFVVVARGADLYGNRGTAHERVTLFFEKELGGWKIIDYRHQYARAGGRL